MRYLKLDKIPVGSKLGKDILYNERQVLLKGGAILTDGIISKLKEKGFNKVVIGCLDGNPSNEFYKHLAGKFIKQENWNIFDECYKENIYLYEI